MTLRGVRINPCEPLWLMNHFGGRIHDVYQAFKAGKQSDVMLEAAGQGIGMRVAY